MLVYSQTKEEGSSHVVATGGEVDEMEAEDRWSSTGGGSEGNEMVVAARRDDATDDEVGATGREEEVGGVVARVARGTSMGHDPQSGLQSCSRSSLA